MISSDMTIRFAFVLLLTALVGVCGWDEFGLKVPADVHPPTNRKRRISSIWDGPRMRQQRIYRIREEMAYGSSLQYKSFLEMEMESFSLSMSMIPSQGPTGNPVHSEPPSLQIPTASPIVSTPSSGPTATTTSVPSDEPTTNPVHSEPPALVIPTPIPSNEPTINPVHTEPPGLVIPTLVPSDEPTLNTLHTEPPGLVIPTNVPSDEPTSLQSTPTGSMAPTIQTHEEPNEPSAAPTSAVQVPTTSPAPTQTHSQARSLNPSHSAVPTTSQSPTASAFPSNGPSTSWAPTLSASAAPSQNPSVSPFPTVSTRPSSSSAPSSPPSTSPVPTRTGNPTAFDPSQIPTFVPSSQSQVAPTLTFDCLDNEILSLGNATDENTTSISLVVGYHVESSSNSTDDYLADLEQSLLLTAVAAALGCNRPDVRRRHLVEVFVRNLLQNSKIIDSVPCNTTVIGAESCTTIETELVFFLKGEVDPDRAAFSGYSAIRDKMANDGYIGEIPTVLKLIYKSPLPLPAPPQVIEDEGTNNGNDSTINARDAAKLQVSSWTIGACVASVFGGAVSLLVWSRNRRSRHLRHIQLVDDYSSVETSSRNPVEV